MTDLKKLRKIIKTSKIVVEPGQVWEVVKHDPYVYTIDPLGFRVNDIGIGEKFIVVGQGPEIDPYMNIDRTLDRWIISRYGEQMYTYDGVLGFYFKKL